MAVAVIGGLITSTVLSLLVIPSVFTVMDDFEHWMGKVKRWARREKARRTATEFKPCLPLPVCKNQHCELHRATTAAPWSASVRPTSLPIDAHPSGQATPQKSDQSGLEGVFKKTAQISQLAQGGREPGAIPR